MNQKKTHGNSSQPSSDRRDYTDIVKNNPRFEQYYNELNLISDDDERQAFWDALRRDLPNSFRFCGSKGHALLVQRKMTEKFIPELSNVRFEDMPVEPPQPMPWYPSGLAWQMTTAKRIVRKFPPFGAFQRFLVLETGVGNISRQEAVSMIPPLLIDLQPHHTVLDLCAAPGSKSAQLVEMLHTGEEQRTQAALVAGQNGHAAHGDQGRSTGLLIANDLNYSRAQMLVHQLKRLNSPNLIVTNHDATMFPSIQLYDKDAAGNPKSKWLKFDRILADVPCTGDGTCRKNPNIWKDWTPNNALGLYVTQVRILVRTLQMLKVGGRAVYSTCSLNPMENEAVVASAIERCGGPDKVSIVNVDSQLPELKRYPGLKSWKVMDKEGRMWSSFEDVENATAAKFEASLQRIVPGMFPEFGADLPLENCMRVYPHQQDTGGFFITVLEKKSEIKAKPESQAKQTNNVPTVLSLVDQVASVPQGQVPFLKEDPMDMGEDPTKPTHDDLINRGNTSAAARQNKAELSDTEPMIQTGKRPLTEVEVVGDSDSANVKRARTEKDDADLGKISENGSMEHWPPPPANQLTETKPAAVPQKRRRGDQPVQEESFKFLDPEHAELKSIFTFYDISKQFPRDRFLVRNAEGDPKKGIYYTTELGKEILISNEGKGLKFVHGGVKMFVKQETQGANTCRWRVQSEGLSIIEGWMGKQRTIRLTKRPTLRYLLKEMFPKVGGDHWKDVGEIGEQVRDMKMGCCVLEVVPSDAEDGFE